MNKPTFYQLMAALVLLTVAIILDLTSHQSEALILYSILLIQLCVLSLWLDYEGNQNKK
jgi:glucose dehydrogenase